MVLEMEGPPREVGLAAWLLVRPGQLPRQHRPKAWSRPLVSRHLQPRSRRRLRLQECRLLMGYV